MQKIIKYLRLPFVFDTMRLQEETAHLSSYRWQDHYQKLHYEGEWNAIPLRSIEGKADSILVSPLSDSSYGDTVFLQESPYMQEVLGFFQFPLKSVRLLKLHAGAIIKEHCDAELCYERGEIRLHIPVITHPDVEFYLDGERVHPAEGECWYMNFNLKHSVINKSPVNRIHLVIDGEVNDWVKEIFSDPRINIRKEVSQYDLLDRSTKEQMLESFRRMDNPAGKRLATELEEHLRTMSNGQS